jgi:hypothetical protein
METVTEEKMHMFSKARLAVQSFKRELERRRGRHRSSRWNACGRPEASGHRETNLSQEG